MAPERYGSYLVYEQLGKGGMATVHRAEQDTRQGIRQVALKRLVPTLDRRLVSLFLDEARLLRYLHHPNIPETYDSGRVFGTYFIAMEYIPGRTLKELVEQCRKIGPVPQAIVLNLATQLCDALDYAHKRRDEQDRPLGIIHRDVTPANLILSATGVLKLVDFGLAKAARASEPSVAGVIKGKLGYVAPEYTRGEEIDHRADLWAVGIILYELLTGGRQLFDGPNAVDTIARVRALPIPRPSLANPQVHPGVDEIVLSALERDPRRRWPSAASMRDRIRAVSAQLGDPADNQRVLEWVSDAFQRRGRAVQLTPMVPMPIYPGTSAEPAARTAPPAPEQPRRRVWIACAAAIALLVIGVLAWAIVHARHAAPTVPAGHAAPAGPPRG
ncbi:MAG TPA: serine/threonine-protein kinase [Kofleriaceae bacterium]|nr:serine/threonine-protein kinase [Kofleriaceae bacterium]